MLINADTVIDVFESCIDCFSSLLNTDVGAWIGGCIVLLAVVRLIKSLQRI